MGALSSQAMWPQCTLKLLIKGALKGTLILEALFWEANKQLVNTFTHVAFELFNYTADDKYLPIRPFLFVLIFD